MKKLYIVLTVSVLAMVSCNSGADNKPAADTIVAPVTVDTGLILPSSAADTIVYSDSALKK